METSWLQKHWVWVAAIGGAIAVYILTRPPLCCSSTPTPTAPGTDVQSLMDAFTSAVKTQTDALSQLENSNANVLLQGEQQLYSGISGLAAGLSTLQPQPTPTLPELFHQPTADELSQIATAGGGTVQGKHLARLDTTGAQQALICQLAKAFPSVFPPDPNNANPIQKYCQPVPSSVYTPPTTGTTTGG